MPKQTHTLSADNLRHAEYYSMQDTFDSLYAKSKNGEKFTDLMDYILSDANILLAYRNLKTNKGSETAGTDNVTIGRLSEEQMLDVNKALCCSLGLEMPAVG